MMHFPKSYLGVWQVSSPAGAEGRKTHERICLMLPPLSFSGLLVNIVFFGFLSVHTTPNNGKVTQSFRPNLNFSNQTCEILGKALDFVQSIMLVTPHAHDSCMGMWELQAWYFAPSPSSGLLTTTYHAGKSPKPMDFCLFLSVLSSINYISIGLVIFCRELTACFYFT